MLPDLDSISESCDRVRCRAALTTLQRIEQNEGVVKWNFSTILKIQKALEQAGIKFSDDEAGEIGVSLQKDTR